MPIQTHALWILIDRAIGDPVHVKYVVDVL